MSEGVPFQILDAEGLEAMSEEGLNAITTAIESFYGEDGVMTTEHSAYYRKLSMYDLYILIILLMRMSVLYC